MAIKDLILLMVNAGVDNDFCKETFALANSNKTIAELVNLILSHKDSDSPRWLAGEKNRQKGTEVGDAKAISTLVREADRNTDGKLSSVWAQQALNFRNWAGHYEQTKSKKFKTKGKGDARTLLFDGKTKGSGKRLKKALSVLHSELMTAVQESINENRACYTEDARIILLSLLAKVDVKGANQLPAIVNK